MKTWFLKATRGTLLVVQLRLRAHSVGVWVPCLVWELDLTCLDEEFACHNYDLKWPNKYIFFFLKKASRDSSDPLLKGSSVYCCFSVAQSCRTLCDRMDCSMPGFPVLHHVPELAQTPVCPTRIISSSINSKSTDYRPWLHLQNHFTFAIEGNIVTEITGHHIYMWRELYKSVHRHTSFYCTLFYWTLQILSSYTLRFCGNPAFSGDS